MGIDFPLVWAYRIGVGRVVTVKKDDGASTSGGGDKRWCIICFTDVKILSPWKRMEYSDSWNILLVISKKCSIRWIPTAVERTQGTWWYNEIWLEGGGGWDDNLGINLEVWSDADLSIQYANASENAAGRSELCTSIDLEKWPDVGHVFGGDDDEGTIAEANWWYHSGRTEEYW